MTDPSLVDSWSKQALVYIHGIGWVLGVGFLLGMKWMAQKWLINMWGKSIRSFRHAFSAQGAAITEETIDALDDPEAHARGVALRKQMADDENGYRKLLQDMNATAVGQVAYLSAKLQAVESERDHKDMELAELRLRLSRSDQISDDLRHECRKARHAADLLCEKYSITPNQWKDLP